jgi:hypothetical protein
MTSSGADSAQVRVSAAHKNTPPVLFLPLRRKTSETTRTRSKKKRGGGGRLPTEGETDRTDLSLLPCAPAVRVSFTSPLSTHTHTHTYLYIPRGVRCSRHPCQHQVHKVLWFLSSSSCQTHTPLSGGGGGGVARLTEEVTKATHTQTNKNQVATQKPVCDPYPQ